MGRREVRTLCEAKVEWEPGSRTLYHGLTGHFLAAEVVRQVSGRKPWEAICRERLFGPIGAASLTFRKPGRETPVALTPRSPELAFAPDSPEFKLGPTNIAGHPAGGAFGTAGDLLKVLHLHLNNGVWGGKALIKPDALRQMHTVQYAAAIRKAHEAGQPPAHQPWGLGILIRGDGPADPVHHGFGLGQVGHAGLFGHAGIGTIIGVADPSCDAALVFLTTDTPKPDAKVASVRSGVVARVLERLA
jgi:CubicO group peptidase (beta-lactamase class C family)